MIIVYNMRMRLCKVITVEVFQKSSQQGIDGEAWYRPSINNTTPSSIDPFQNNAH